MVTATNSKKVSKKIVLPGVILLFCIALTFILIVIFRESPLPEFQLVDGDIYYPDSEIIIRALNRSARQEKALTFEINELQFPQVASAIIKNREYLWQIPLTNLALPDSIRYGGAFEVCFGFVPEKMSFKQKIYIYSDIMDDITRMQIDSIRLATPKLTSKDKDVSQEIDSQEKSSDKTEPSALAVDDNESIGTIIGDINDQDDSLKERTQIPSTGTGEQYADISVSNPGANAIQRPDVDPRQVIPEGSGDTIKRKTKNVKDSKSILKNDEFAKNFKDDFQVTVKEDTTGSIDDRKKLAKKEDYHDRYLPATTPPTQKVTYTPPPANVHYLTIIEMKDMLKTYNFFDMDRNNSGKGVNNQFQVKSIRGSKVILDKATGLMWQQSGSDTKMSFEEAKNWIKELNRQRVAGYNNWRLPSLQEAMTLMEPKMNNSGLNISPDFDNLQILFWTSDYQSTNAVWVVNFDLAGCNYYMVTQTAYVRAVR